MSTRTMPVTEAKQKFTEIVREAEAYYDRTVVTKNGMEAAVVMSVREYEGLLETLDILSNRTEVKAIAEGMKEARRGKTIDLAAYQKSIATPKKAAGVRGR